jgi:glyoxylase-like metal-dependent hydrolase (beta-lactamase superfamily II)
MTKEIFRKSLTELLFAIALFGFTSSTIYAQETEKYVPVLPKVKERMLPVDYSKGYLVKEIKPDVYIITDGAYQSMFVTTGKGVILFDAPPSFGQHIIKAVAEVTKEPIRKLIYSHAHVDHTASAEFLKDIPNLEIIAEKEVADMLQEMKDPRRLIPTKTFINQTKIEFGTAEIELKKAGFHSNEGDLYIYLPKQKVLMAIDTLAPGYVPFMNFDLTVNMHEYLKMFDQLLAYDFDVLVAGHLTSLGTRQDVVDNKNYALDVYQTVKRIHNSADQNKMAMDTIQKYGADNKFLIFNNILEPLIEQSYQEIKGRWIDKLAGVDVYGRSHVRTMLIYVRWDDKL